MFVLTKVFIDEENNSVLLYLSISDTIDKFSTVIITFWLIYNILRTVTVQLPQTNEEFILFNGVILVLQIMLLWKHPKMIYIAYFNTQRE